MPRSVLFLLGFACVLLCRHAGAQLPPPPDTSATAEWSFPWGDDVPGALSYANLMDKPAGKNGPVVAKDGHFFTGGKRIKFVGVNLAFGANFPEHTQADALAKRFAGFGVNCVRFHHMDNQVFPNGIFADRELEKLSPEALDRLDYFVAALKKEGVYANLNLHVSRPWSRTKKWPEASKLEGYDKQVDIFHPDLIAANKQYAKDLLTHVNAYTKTQYADEPAVAMVEINNEDTLFLWGGEQKLAELPEPYAAMLQKLWNEWLVRKYKSRETLASAWAQGAEPLGKELIDEPLPVKGKWNTEQHGTAKMRVSAEGESVAFQIDAVDGTVWHLQHSRSGLQFQKGRFYTVELTGRADAERKIEVSVGRAHAPWGNLGLARSITLKPGKEQRFKLGFVASEADENGRVSLQFGASTAKVFLGKLSVREGGREGLREGEDPAAGSVARGGMGASDAPLRTRDWYDFLQHTDESYFTGMRDWLKTEIGVKSPITGTIGLGMLGTKSQRGMDFVDAHAYWDHPHFPRRQWDMKDWEIKNKPMVDDPAGATLWGLAATRVFGRPFTVTEYNHAAPNEWQAECVPMIFAYAALQDWDAVFLFDYSGDRNYQRTHTTNFFSIEGNPTKMAALPLAARIFSNTRMLPQYSNHALQNQKILDTASRYFFQQWPFMRDVQGAIPPLDYRLSVTFEGQMPPPYATIPPEKPTRVEWKSAGVGTGRFLLRDPYAASFIGFAKGEFPVDLGAVQVTSLQTPFAAIQVVPADPGKPIAGADRVLISAVARQSSEGMNWDEKRTGVSNQWGKAPARVEVVKGELSLASARPVEVWALGPDGKRTKQVATVAKDGRVQIPLGSEPTVWYEVVRK